MKWFIRRCFEDDTFAFFIAFSFKLSFVEIFSLHLYKDTVRKSIDSLDESRELALVEKSQYKLNFPALSASLKPLMNVLRLLRTCKQSMTSEETSRLSSYLSSQEAFVTLWDTLIECLVTLRRFRDFHPASTMSATHRTQSLNTIEIQFVPLIECFMEICTMTLIEDKSVTPMSRAPSVESVEMRRRHMEEQNYYIRRQLQDSPLCVRLIKFAEENSMLINAVLRQNIKLLKSSLLPMLVVPSCRRHLDFKVKRAYLKFQLRKILKMEQEKEENEDDFEDLDLTVRRDDILQSSFNAMHHLSDFQLRKATNITFAGEEGIDGGGLTKEWYQVLTREIFSSKFNLFQTMNETNPTYQPCATSGIDERHLEYFEFAGKIVAKAICDGELLDVHFSRSFYKHILGIPIIFQDLEAFDLSYYKSMKMLLDNKLEDLGIDITFSTEVTAFGITNIVDLKENGRNLAVNDDNKEEYANLIAHHKMSVSLQEQIDSFLDGFYRLIPPELISIFDPQQLELMICGLPDIDFDDLRAHTTYQGYKSSDVQITHLWNVLRTFSKEEKALFLQFVTGTSKVPLDGFRALHGNGEIKHFNVHRAYDTNLLPTAHTCFNQLDLPEYQTEEELREKLLIAIREGAEGFAFA